MEHLSHNQCLDLHIQHRDDPDFIDLLCRYEDAMHHWHKFAKEAGSFRKLLEEAERRIENAIDNITDLLRG